MAKFITEDVKGSSEILESTKPTPAESEKLSDLPKIKNLRSGKTGNQVQRWLGLKDKL